MKIVHVEKLISCGDFSVSPECAELNEVLFTAVKAVDWPPGTGKFIIYPESGKKRGQGNGVTPIKRGLMTHLRDKSWELECRLDVATSDKPGKLDAVLRTSKGPFAVEWETGNISSSHRALNKMALGLLKKVLIGGVLIVPTRALYAFLTDRVGNYNELVPYLDLWRAIPCSEGVLEIIVVEHDGTSLNVPRIPKGTDGRALA